MVPTFQINLLEFSGGEKNYKLVYVSTIESQIFFDFFFWGGVIVLHLYYTFDVF